MLSHFVRRDFLDQRPYWGMVAAVTVLYAVALFFQGPEIFRTQLLGMAYFIFGMSGESWVMGTAWRSQYHLSRHYLLALPIRHKTLFVIQHIRIAVFWVPVLIAGIVAPWIWGELAGRLAMPRYLFHLFALLTSIALVIESSMWMTLEMERLSRYVPAGRRLWTWVRAIILQCGALAILGLGWFDLWARPLIGPPRARILPTLVPLAGTLPWIVFPAALLLAIAWFRHNARRWCVTL
jgi:hypothetical protein